MEEDSTWTKVDGGGRDFQSTPEKTESAEMDWQSERILSSPEWCHFHNISIVDV